MMRHRAEYFNRIYGWYAVGGLGAVAHHLATLGLAGYDAKRPPRQTVAFHDIAALSQAPEIGDTADVLGRLG
jgi:hypothetical protein